MCAGNFGEDEFRVGGRGLEWDVSAVTVVVFVDATAGYCFGFVYGQMGLWVDGRMDMLDEIWTGLGSG